MTSPQDAPERVERLARVRERLYRMTDPEASAIERRRARTVFADYDARWLADLLADLTPRGRSGTWFSDADVAAARLRGYARTLRWGRPSLDLEREEMARDLLGAARLLATEDPS